MVKKLKKRIRLVRDIGISGVNDISRLVTRDPYACVVELVANAYDADASECRINYNPKSRTFSIVDDGSGMTPKNLTSFYILGDSPKRSSPISPEGRRTIGKFGVATIVIPNMCQSYHLITRKDGLETSLTEVFDGMLKRGKNIDYKDPIRIDRTQHGTEIHMEKLKFGEWNNFFLPKLFQTLQWEFQLPPDFQIYLNNKRVEAKQISHAERFEVDEDFEDGKIHGTMYLLNRRHEQNGIHIYINGRRVGDPSSFVNYSRLASPARGKILGILHANPLEKAILFDRGRLDESDLHVVNFRTLVGKLNNKLATDARKKSDKMRKHIIEQNIPSALRRIIEYLYRSKISEFRIGTEISFSEDLNNDEIGRVENDTKRIYLNSKHPQLIVPSGELKLPFQSRTHYESTILLAIVDTLAQNRASDGRGEVNFPTFLAERKNILEKLKKIS